MCYLALYSVPGPRRAVVDSASCASGCSCKLTNSGHQQAIIYNYPNYRTIKKQQYTRVDNCTFFSVSDNQDVWCELGLGTGAYL